MWMCDGSSLATSRSMPRPAEFKNQTFFSLMCGESFLAVLSAAAACGRFGLVGVTLKRSFLRFGRYYNRRNLRLCKNEGVPDMTVTDRPLRADAQRNRDRLLAAATEA